MDHFDRFTYLYVFSTSSLEYHGSYLTGDANGFQSSSELVIGQDYYFGGFSGTIKDFRFYSSTTLNYNDILRLHASTFG